MAYMETRFSRKWLEKKLAERYFKKPYDRFMWWRSYTPKTKPLGNKATFRDKILNGDYEQGPYLMEVELARHTMNDKYEACITRGGEPDHSKFHQETSIDRARIKRLNEDYEKDESRKLDELRKGFVKEFKITPEEYDKEVLNTNGSVTDFYYEVEDKYGKRGYL
jgi:hypothetical protein|tara:strand:- start:888 stop:1382 length:495 start_codon:yes stop_codon:yes gene_type:complete